MLCRLDEFFGVRTPLSADKLGRIQKCERFPPTSRVSRWKHPNRNCPYGSASALQPNRLHCVATRWSVPPPLSRVRRGLYEAAARSRVSLPRRGGNRGGGAPSEMLLRHDSWPRKVAAGQS